MNEELSELIDLVKESNSLLSQLVENMSDVFDLLAQGASVKSMPAGRRGTSNLSAEAKELIDYGIDLEWWFANYGEEHLPAKYMNPDINTPGVDNSYSKEEADYVYSRLLDFVEEENEQGTHVFKYLGKVWCKKEKNSRNCFAFVPVKG